MPEIKWVGKDVHAGGKLIADAGLSVVGGVIAVASTNFPNVLKETSFGYATAYKAIQLGSISPGPTPRAIALGFDPVTVPGSSFTGNEILMMRGQAVISPNAAGTDWVAAFSIIGPGIGAPVVVAGGFSNNGQALVYSGDIVGPTGGDEFGQAFMGKVSYAAGFAASFTNYSAAGKGARIYANGALAGRIMLHVESSTGLISFETAADNASIRIQSYNGKPLYLNEIGNNVFIGSGLSITGAIASYVDATGAFIDYDGGSGVARIGAKRLGGGSIGTRIQTLSAGAPIVALDIKAAGSVAFIGAVQNLSGQTTCSNGAATPIFTPPAAGLWEVVAYLTGFVTPFQAYALVSHNGSGAVLLRTDTGNGNFTITLSGNTVQVTQTSGGTQVVTWIALLVG